MNDRPAAHRPARPSSPAEADRRRFRLHLVAAVVVGVVARVAMGSLVDTADLRGDSLSFMLLGGRLGEEGVSGFSSYYPALPQAFYWLVGQLVGGTADLTGTGLFGLPVPRLYALSGVVPGAVGIVAVAALARRVGGLRAAAVAAWLTALSPSLLLASPRVMTEVIAVPVVAGLLLACYRLVDEPSTARVAVATLAAAALVLTKAEGMVVVLGLVAVGALGAVRHRRTRPPVASAGALVALALVPLVVLVSWGWWSNHNEPEATLEESGMSSFGVTALAGNCESAYRSGRYLAWKSYPCIGLGPDDDPEVARFRDDPRPRKLLVENLREAGPARVVGVSTLKVLRANGLFAPAGTIELQEIEQEWPADGFVVLMGWWWCLLAVAGGGAAVVRRTGTALAPLLVPVVVANAAIFATWGNPRYRILGEPVLIVLAACLLAAAAGHLSRRRTGYQSPEPSSGSSGTTRSQRSMQSSQR